MEKGKQINNSMLKLLKIPSGDDIIVGRMYLAEGEGPHGTVVLLHGFPGGMMNLDLASELQQEGWNVLVINYRGAWGSQGSFSFSHSIEDVRSALQYLKESDVAKENHIDPNRIGLIGHSFGGFLALKVASMEPSILAVASLSGANFGLFAQMVEQDPSFEAQIREVLKEGAFFLNGASVESIMEEVRFNQNEWNTFLFAPLLLERKILLTAADLDEELPKVFFHDPLVEILKQAGANHLQSKVFETDHHYLNHRKELAQTLHNWLLEVL
ncbi:alpha/beta hydrolase family protein [Peribacillus alkalitolerans]|uniref:alpha/beta hydrolase family protein n=1 Tax=Peribacillus alkalitolerans TaxID=1550385 RepID=UPI0013D47185|nr:alpha/beta hydrolase [Peribacillus alkalitolerans]